MLTVGQKVELGSVGNLNRESPVTDRIGHFDMEGDNRSFGVKNFHIPFLKRNTSSSVHREEGGGILHCTACKERHRMDDGRPILIILADQNFPPCLPTEDGPCIAILRIEDALVSELPDLIREYFGAGKNCVIPEGSVILFGSAAHLAERGLVNYCEELVRVVREISTMTGGKASVGHYILIFRGETSNKGFIRDLLDLEAWLSTDKNVARTLPETRNALWDTILRMHSAVSNMESINRRYFLPESMHNGRRIIVDSPGFKGRVPAKITPFSLKDEQGIISCMINEINEKFGLSMAIPDVSRSCATWQSGGADSLKIYVCGGSHATRVAEKLVTAGQQVINLARGGWQPTEQSVDEVYNNLKIHGLGKGNAADVIVIDPLANCVFCGSDDDGNLTPIEKMGDGKFHVPGNLAIYPVAKVRARLNLWSKVMSYFMSCKYVILLPTPRYISEPCCTSRAHCTNFQDPDMHSDIVGGIGLIVDCIRRFANSQGIDYELMDILSPYSNIECLIPVESEDGRPLWPKGDPIHFRHDVYSAAADLVLGLVCSGDAEEGSTSEAASKKLRLESIVVRLQGMKPVPVQFVKPSWSTGTFNPQRGERGGHATRGYRGRPPGGRGHY